MTAHEPTTATETPAAPADDLGAGMTPEMRRGYWKARERRTPGFCRRCGYAGINVRHDTIEERAASQYHKWYSDVPLCDFQAGGRPR